MILFLVIWAILMVLAGSVIWVILQFIGLSLPLIACCVLGGVALGLFAKTKPLDP